MSTYKEKIATSYEVLRDYSQEEIENAIKTLSEDSLPEEYLQALAEAGIVLSENQITQLAEIWSVQVDIALDGQEALSDEELENVAGGCGTPKVDPHTKVAIGTDFDLTDNKKCPVCGSSLINGGIKEETNTCTKNQKFVMRFVDCIGGRLIWRVISNG